MQKKAPYDSIALRLKNAGARDKTAKTSKKRKAPNRPLNQAIRNPSLERETGIGPATPTLARWCSTAEPLAQIVTLIIYTKTPGLSTP